MIAFEQAVKLAAAYLEPDLFPWSARQLDNGWVIASNTYEKPEAEKWFGCPYVFVSREDGSVEEFNFVKNLEQCKKAPVARFFYVEDGEIVVNPNIDEECADW